MYRRKQRNSVRNYVDSNGRDAGIAIEDGNPLTRALRRVLIGFPTLKNNPTNGDFDDDIPEDLINEPKPNLGTLSNKNEFNNDNGNVSSGFVVNRPKPLRLVNQDFVTDADSETYATSELDTQSPNINKEEVEEGDVEQDEIYDRNTESTDDIDTDQYEMAASRSGSISGSVSAGHAGALPHLDIDLSDSE